MTDEGTEQPTPPEGAPQVQHTTPLPMPGMPGGGIPLPPVGGSFPQTPPPSDAGVQPEYAPTPRSSADPARGPSLRLLRARCLGRQPSAGYPVGSRAEWPTRQIQVPMAGRPHPRRLTRASARRAIPAAWRPSSERRRWSCWRRESGSVTWHGRRPRTRRAPSLTPARRSRRFGRFRRHGHGWFGIGWFGLVGCIERPERCLRHREEGGSRAG